MRFLVQPALCCEPSLTRPGLPTALQGWGVDVTLSRSCCNVPWPGLCARHKEGSTRRLGRETGVGELRAACAPGTPSLAGVGGDAGQVPLRLGACLLAGDTVRWPFSCPIKLDPMEKPHVWGPHKGKLPWKCPHDAHNSQGEVTEGRGAGWSAQGWRREDTGLGPHMHAGGLGVALG